MTLRELKARARGAYSPWARLCLVAAEPHRDHKLRPEPYTETYFNPFEDEKDDPGQPAGRIPLDGKMAARIGDLLERRKLARTG